MESTRYEVTIALTLVVGLAGLFLAFIVNMLLFAYLQGMFSGIPIGETIPTQSGVPAAVFVLGIVTTFLGFIGGMGINAHIKTRHVNKPQPRP